MCNDLSRRRLLACLGVTALAPIPVFGTQAVPPRQRVAINLGLQLYTLNREALADLAGTLAMVRAIGFRRIELAGTLGRSATELRGFLDRAGLRCSSIHLPASPTASGAMSLSDDPSTLAAQLRILGCERAVLPTFLMAPEARPRLPGESGLHYVKRVGLKMRAQDWQRNADFLNRTGKGLKREGIALGYHNHNPEFAPLADGNTGMDLLLASTDPDCVHFELDAGWAAAAGIDPAALLRHNPGRFHQMHAKDVSRNTKSNFVYRQNPRAIGYGKTNWLRLTRVAIDCGVREFFIEQEPPYPVDAVTAITQSFRFFERNFALQN